MLIVQKVLTLAALLVRWTHTEKASQLETSISNPVCVQIARAISTASDVYYFGQPHYQKDISHWASSSTQLPKCSVEPGTAEDVAIILKIIGATRTPFAVKGGGHTGNPGFSSTNGVHIAMYRFSEITYHKSSQTVDIGTGLIWDDVYAALEPHAVNVVGGRVSGVGVAGFTLGGGYSWKSNQYGLTVDTVTAFELVKPSGAIVAVTHSSDPDLFFALKGGFNNFGIVTKLTLKTFPQTEVWGGLIWYTGGQINNVTAAVSKFSSTVTDPKAAIISAYNYFLGQPGIAQLIFYDGPSPPTGIFDDFLAIPAFSTDISTRSFLSLVRCPPSNTTSGTRGIFNTVSILEYTPAILNAILNETKFWGKHLLRKTNFFLSYDVQLFLPTVLSHSASASAYPPSRSQFILPLDIYYAWTSSFFDSDIQEAIRQSAIHLYNVALAEGQVGVVDAALYTNYAIFDTPLEKMYGHNVPRLQAIKAAVDPTNIMGLAGGIKF